MVREEEEAVLKKRKKENIVTSGKCKIAEHNLRLHYPVKIRASHIKCTALKYLEVCNLEHSLGNPPLIFSKEVRVPLVKTKPSTCSHMCCYWLEAHSVPEG